MFDIIDSLCPWSSNDVCLCVLREHRIDKTVILKWTSNKICPQELIIDMQQAKWIKPLFFLSLFTPYRLSLLSFSQDVPKDYRHVSLTGVKQRFEDEAYQHISKEKVLYLTGTQNKHFEIVARCVSKLFP